MCSRARFGLRNILPAALRPFRNMQLQTYNHTAMVIFDIRSLLLTLVHGFHDEPDQQSFLRRMEWPGT